MEREKPIRKRIESKKFLFSSNYYFSLQKTFCRRNEFTRCTPKLVWNSPEVISFVCAVWPGVRECLSSPFCTTSTTLWLFENKREKLLQDTMSTGCIHQNRMSDEQKRPTWQRACDSVYFSFGTTLLLLRDVFCSERLRAVPSALPEGNAHWKLFNRTQVFRVKISYFSNGYNCTLTVKSRTNFHMRQSIRFSPFQTVETIFKHRKIFVSASHMQPQSCSTTSGDVCRFHVCAFFSLVRVFAIVECMQMQYVFRVRECLKWSFILFSTRSCGIKLNAATSSIHCKSYYFPLWARKLLCRICSRAHIFPQCGAGWKIAHFGTSFFSSVAQLF